MGARIEFEDNDKKDIIKIKGGSEMQDPFKHMGKVEDGDW